MDAALQVGFAIAGAREHVGSGLDVARLAGMAGAHERDLRRREAEALDAACRRKRYRLQRLERAARQRKVLGVARGVDQRLSASTTATEP
jgi:hypothetical protein